MINHFNKNKKLFSLLLSLVLTLGIFLAPLHDVVFAEDAEDITEITIVHTNDTHARIKEGVGFAKISTIVNGLKEEKGKENVLLLDAGDTLHGLPLASIPKGKSIVDVMNLVGYDAMVPGNHDFNYGYDRLLELNDMAKFPIIAANMQPEPETGIRLLDKSIIKDIDGLKVGIFGLATPETKYKSNPKNTEGIEFKAPVEAARNMVAKLKDEGADIIIALSHLGMDEETAKNERSTTVAAQVEGIDLIIDGHSHSTLKEGKIINGTLIAQTGSHTNNVGVVDITVKDGKISKEARLITAEEAENINEDKEVEALIERIEEENKEITSEVIGEAKVKLDGERENVRAGETNLANLITDIMLEAGNADVVITNGGGIRASIEAGEITMGDVIAVLPFGNYLVVKEVKGSDILAALEHGTKAYPEPSGGFPQVAGMTYKLDLSAEVGNRVHSVEVNDEPLDLNKTYKLATNDFMAAGGDGYTSLGGGELIVELPGLDEIVAEGIRDMEAVEGKLDKRMTVEDKPVVEPEEPKEEDKEAADEVINIIDELPEEITLENKEAVKEARKAYDALTEEQKALVTNIDKLEAAEAKISELEKVDEDEKPGEKPGEKPKTKPEKPTPEKPKGKGSLPKTGAAPWAATGLVGALMVAAGWKLKRKK